MSNCQNSAHFWADSVRIPHTFGQGHITDSHEQRNSRHSQRSRLIVLVGCASRKRQLSTHKWVVVSNFAVLAEAENTVNPLYQRAETKVGNCQNSAHIGWQVGRFTCNGWVYRSNGFSPNFGVWLTIRVTLLSYDAEK